MEPPTPEGLDSVDQFPWGGSWCDRHYDKLHLTNLTHPTCEPVKFGNYNFIKIDRRTDPDAKTGMQTDGQMPIVKNARVWMDGRTPVAKPQTELGTTK